MSITGKLPLGRAQRLIQMAGAGARAGAHLLIDKGHERAAQQIAETLGNLRGLAAKVGQTLSYVDGILPEGQRPAYEKAMATLRAATPSSSPDAIARVVETELGAPLDRLFVDWQHEPVASASIGQVHRAKLLDGSDVAVKVQHPGIDRAIENDLGNLGLFEHLIGAVGPKNLEADRIFAVVRERFLEELDYELEAEQQRYFARLHDGDPRIRVPRVIAERSARRVLTSEWITGMPLEEATEQGRPLRSEYARALWRFVFKGNLIGARFNADPHPGNYIFQEDGGVTFLDFGCVQRIEDASLVHARAAHRAAIARDEGAFRATMRQMLGLRGGSFEGASLDYTRRCFEPVFASPYRITRPYVASLVSGAQEMKKEIFAKDKSFVPLPPNLVFMNRLQFGFYSIMARFDVELDYAAEERSFIDTPS